MSKNKNIKNFGGKFKKVITEPISICFDNNPVEIVSESIAEVFITKVIYNNPATIVFWSDDTKTVCKCRKPDTYNPETGLIICCLKKLVGGVEVSRLINSWMLDREVAEKSLMTVTLSDVRRHIRDTETAQDAEQIADLNS